jgi:heme exporter protein C
VHDPGRDDLIAKHGGSAAMNGGMAAKNDSMAAKSGAERQDDHLAAWLTVGRVLDVLTVPLVITALYVAMVRAPEAGLNTGGIVQRVFYFHVPFAMAAFLGFVIVLVASIGFLAHGRRSWDATAEAAAETGLLCCTVVLLTGPVWARYAWGTWWTWDARLTSTLVLWLIYAGYLVLRAYMAEDARVRRYAAVLGIIGALNVPIVYLSVRWFRTQHPETLIMKQGGLDPSMAVALRLGMLAVFTVFAALLVKRLLLGRLEARVAVLRAGIEARE